MKLLALYWSFLIIGYLMATRLRKRGIVYDWMPKVMMGVIYCLCFVMGLRMGVNEQVTSNLGTIGVEALAVTAVCVGGSMFAIFVLRKILRINRYGDAVAEIEGHSVKADDRVDEKEGNKLDLKNTIIILGVVALGMLLGALLIARRFPGYLAGFDGLSSYALILLLCILMLLVGFDMGTAGSIFATIKKVGAKAFGFAIAAMVGTMIFGTAFCLIVGFSLKESLAICVGFGWYSYAPVVIASAGQQYIIASAVSFMHNVIREVAGIILIPIFASRFGYIESTGIPGSAAMDVCMPIVERSCRPDTVVYSFTTGLMMCITTSIFVPLVMGV